MPGHLRKTARFALYLAKYAAGLPKYRFLSRREVFADIHTRGIWRNSETHSGDSSTLARTEKIRAALPALFEKYSIESMLDIPCGDFNWMPSLERLPNAFIAADIVPEIVEENRMKHPGIDFRVLDICADPLPVTDLVFCRDCLVHLPLKDAIAALDNIRSSGAKFLMATTFPKTRVNRGVTTGAWRPLNLEKPPFSLPPPLETINEDFILRAGRHKDKSMALWELDSHEG
jgi:SAM-dependent methyltransferase